MSKLQSIRHGEMVLQPVNLKPEGEVASHASFIVGHSETGHHHVLESEAKFEVIKTGDRELYVRLYQPASLVHKKDTDAHKTLPVLPGTYRIHKKTEYNPFEKVIEQVTD